jgi:hypothetical protein
MKNKKLLYGGLLALAVFGIYMWDKNKKKASCSCSSAVKPQGTPTSETYSAMSGYANAGGGTQCRICERANGTTYFAKFGGCADGDSCITSVRPKKAY